MLTHPNLVVKTVVTIHWRGDPLGCVTASYLLLIVHIVLYLLHRIIRNVNGVKILSVYRLILNLVGIVLEGCVVQVSSSHHEIAVSLILVSIVAPHAACGGRTIFVWHRIYCI